MAVRRRLGLLVPSTNSVAEPDVHAAVPDGVTVHVHRLFLPDNVSKKDAMDRMNSDLVTGATYLATARVEAICMTGTTNSFYQGAAGADWMETTMSTTAKVPAVASSLSVVLALKHYGATKLSVATPYADWANERLREFLVASGFDVLNLDNDPRVADGHPQHMNDQDPEEIREFALSVWRGDADAMFLSCAAWRAMEVAASIEEAIGKPVITTNQATVWRALRTMGISTARRGFGRLLDEMPDPAAVTA
jgi:maleate isomerase